MQIEFSIQKLKKLCESSKKLNRKYGNQVADTVMLRLEQLGNCETLSVMKLIKPANCHELKFDKKGCLAVDVGHIGRGRYRIVFIAKNKDAYDEKNQIRWNMITHIEIAGIVDYHKE